MKAFISVIIMALVTYIPRVLPVSIFRKEIKSVYIKSLLYYVPYAVLAALTFPAIFWSTGNEAAAIAGTVTAVILAYFEMSLVVVAIAAIAVVFGVGFLF
jgi:branched-subunit amino acid transport protein